MESGIIQPGITRFYTQKEWEALVYKNDAVMRKFSYNVMKAVSEDCLRHSLWAEKDRTDKLPIVENMTEDTRLAFSKGCAYMAEYFKKQWSEFKEENSH